MTAHVRPPPPPVLDDRAFFKAHPHRSHRVRLAHQEEIEEAEAAGAFSAGTAHLPVYVLIAQVAPGARLRSLVALRKDWSGCGEERARRLWLEMTGLPTMPRAVPVVLWGAEA